jgi:hypothetical protein
MVTKIRAYLAHSQIEQYSVTTAATPGVTYTNNSPVTDLATAIDMA